MPSRIDRYIAGLFWTYFIGGLLVFVTIFLAVDAMGLLVGYKDVAASSLIKYYAYYAPTIIYQMLPVACLLATVFTLSTLSKSNELVALFSVGMSLIRITFSMLLSVLVISIGVLFLSDRILPNFSREKTAIMEREIKKKQTLSSTIKNERIWYRSKDNIFNIKTLNEETHKAQGLTLYYFNSQWELIQMITAKEVDLLGENWKLKDGSVTLFTEDSSFPLTSSFKQKTVVMGEDAQDLSSTGSPSDVLSLAELSNYIKKNKEAGLDTVRYEVSYHSKYGFAFAALVMSLLGIPFSVGKARSGGIMLNIGICLGLVFLYWVLYSSALTLGNYGQIPPVIAAWLPNVAIAGLAAYFIVKSKK